jgi:cell division protein FtsA
MLRTPDKHLVTALDIGTSKVVAMVAEVTEDNKLHIIGVGSHPSKGLKKGVIVNIDATVTAIQKAVSDAEHMADCKIRSVTVGVAGSHIKSFNSHGVVAIRNQEVSETDVDRVIDAAKAIALSADQRILHILPQEFIIDHQEGIHEPVGMSGVRLEAKVHLVTGSVSAVQNIVKCVQACGLQVEDLVLEQLASSYGVLSDDEKELGVCLIDIGGGTTDIAVFTEGAIRHTSVVPIAGDQVTNDVAHALRTPTQYAEAIKLDHGCALARLADVDESVQVKGVGDRPGRRLSLQTLAGVMESRYEELLTLVHQDLKRSGYLDALAGGIVLTGGASQVPGLLELAEEIFRMPVRLGIPQKFTGMAEIVGSPIHSTGVGLLHYCHQQKQSGPPIEIEANVDIQEQTIIEKMKRWFSKYF